MTSSIGERYVEIKPDTSGFASAAKKALAVAGVAAGAALAAGIAGAFNADAMNAKLKAQLGLTAAQSAKAGKVAGSLFGQNYGTGMEQINVAVKSVIQDIGGMRGASNKVLEDISKKALNTANIFDQDLGGVTRAVGQLMKTGLAKNAKQAMDIVTAGFQKGADKSGDFLDTLNEYGTQFRKVGIDGMTATGLISQGLQGGARDADIVADSIKEFSIRAVDGSKLTAGAFRDLGFNAGKMQDKLAGGGKGAKQGLDQILDKLRAVKDPAERSAIAVALFGTQAEDMGDALLKLDPSKAAKGLGQVKGAAEKANKAFNDTPTAVLQAFIRQIQQGLVDLMANKVIPLIKKVIPPFQQFAAEMKSGEGAGGKFAAVLSAIGSAVANTAKWLNDHRPVVVAVVAAYVAWKVAMIAFRVQQALSLFWLKLHTVGTIQHTIVSKAAAAASKIWAAAVWLVNLAMKANPIAKVVAIIALLVAAVVVAYKTSDKFRAIVDRAWAVIKKAVDVAWNKVIKPVLKAWWAYVTKVLVPTIKGLWDKVVKPVFAFIGKAIDKTWNGVIKPVFKAWWAYISKVLWPTIKFLWEKVVRPVFKAIGDHIKNVWNNGIKPVFSKLKEGVGAIKTAFSRAVDGIKTVWNKLKEAAAAPVRFVVNTVYMKGIFPAVNAIPGVKDLPRISFASGGVLPGYTPGRDVHEFVSRTGGRLHLSGGEGIMRPEWVRAMGGPTAIKRMNWAARMGNLRKVGDVGAFAGGGTLDHMAVQRASAFAHSQAGKPYVWGGVGPGGYDCSGFMSAITNVMRGKSPYSRVGTTASFPWPGFAPGKGKFTIGSANPFPGSGVGHMAGSIESLNVESAGGVGVRLGGAARGWNSSGFNKSGHIGGAAGNIWDPIIAKFKDLWSKMHAAVARLGNMGEWGGMIQKAVQHIAGGIRDWINGKIPGSPVPSFDRGGISRGRRGSLLKNTMRPERVLSPRQTEAFEKLIPLLKSGAMGGFHVHGDVYTRDEQSLARHALAEQRKALAIAGFA